MSGAELRDRIVHRIGAGVEISDEEFAALALELFVHQFRGNLPYRAFCESRSILPGGLTYWSEIPAVPTDAFKAAALVVGSPADAIASFRTSGTTVGRDRRGVHHLLDLSVYRAALRRGFELALLPDGARPIILALVPSWAEAPDSSLSYMASDVLATFGGVGSEHIADGGGLRLPRCLERLRSAAAGDVPVLLFGTAFAFVHLLDHLESAGERFELPPRSRILETGGFKGRSREVERPELYAALERALGIPVPWMINEYGMTEMSSQFYDGRAGEASADVRERVHVGPSWTRTRAYDPETLAPLGHGKTGVLRHWDLANVDSVLALQTADLGTASPSGFQLHGRARGAEARGCSIAMDELMDALRR